MSRLSLFAVTMMMGGVATTATADEMGAKRQGKTTFTIHIENVSSPATLRSASGAGAPAPHSPGLWILHTSKHPVFTAGKLDRGAGLESQAEDGDPRKLLASVKRTKGVVASGAFDTPLGDDEPGPALPGKAYHFTFEASPGDRLTVITMFGQSNDLFYAPGEDGIALFERGEPIRGDVTSRFQLWDAGTEVNEEPGFGPHQAPRQPRHGSGPSERKPVRLIAEVKDGFSYPPTDQVMRVTIDAGATMVN